MTYEPFEIEKILDLGDGLWCVEFNVRQTEKVKDLDVAQATTIRVRFEYSSNGSVQGLLETAYTRAALCAQQTAETLSSMSLVEQQKGISDRLNYDPFAALSGEAK